MFERTAFLDALAGLSQVAGVAEAQAEIEGGTGHGCGHNLLGTGSCSLPSRVPAT